MPCIIGYFEVRAQWIYSMKKESICNTVNDKTFEGGSVCFFCRFLVKHEIFPPSQNGAS